ncbi:MAG: septal ring lytic transglycosylase RlpA family protein [Deltaproteobacteria bacterium]|nr:septal ring lytic transglycosylase RlpA family protein [Deltaproteobacteria bacterium]
MSTRDFLKKAICWPALILCVSLIGGASMLIGYQLADNIQSEYRELIGLHRANLYENVTLPSAVLPPESDFLTPTPSPRPVSPGVIRKVTASWYGEPHHNRLTASGERFEMDKKTLAHRTLPLGTRVRLVNPQNGRSVEGVVNDRGPYIKGRDVDVSYLMAKELGFVNKGVMRLVMETMPVDRDGR